MSGQNRGNMLLQALGALGIALLRVIVMLFAWCCKIVGFAFAKLSELIFKLSEK